MAYLLGKEHTAKEHTAAEPARNGNEYEKSQMNVHVNLLLNA